MANANDAAVVGGRRSNPYHAKYPPPVLPRRERPKELTLAPKSALELLHERLHEQHHHIPLCPDAPPWLQLQPGHIYELSGPGGAGKTQLALQCCINAAQQQPRATIHYLSLQGSRATVSTLAYRLGQMCANDRTILQRIRLIAVHNEEDFLAVLGKHLPPPSSSCLSLLILDSIADLFRGQQQQHMEYATRARTLFAMVQHLRQRERTTVTLILNQVAWHDTPALGLAWSQCVSSRWRVQQQQQQQADTTTRSSSQRWIQVYHDPRFARRKMPFRIGTEGCRLVEVETATTDRRKG